MSALVPRPPKDVSPDLTTTDVPAYVSLIVAAYAVADSMTEGDFMHFPLKTVARAMERRLDAAGLSAEAERVAARMRGEATGDLAPVVALNLVPQGAA
jgi:hypothetical protein